MMACGSRLLAAAMGGEQGQPSQSGINSGFHQANRAPGLLQPRDWPYLHQINVAYT
jgi:hypothetical protein